MPQTLKDSYSYHIVYLNYLTIYSYNIEYIEYELYNSRI